MKKRTRKIVAIIAGEASGDLHGAHVIDALRRQYKDIDIAGAGGVAMKQAGANIVVDAKELSVMGITAVILKAPQIIKLMVRLKRFLAHTRPDVLILIDFPDFNLHMAGYAKKLGIPVLYFIGPQVWAWRSKRIRKIKKRVDHMAVILPFEKQIYEKHKVPVTYVGHPLLDDAAKHHHVNRTDPNLERPTIALLPGSREDEVTRLLPKMLHGAQILQNRNPNTRFVISRATSIEQSVIQQITSACSLQNYDVVTDPAVTVFNRSDLAIVASGTASLEAAIYGIPAIVVYEISAFSYWLAAKVIKVPYIGMANLIAGQKIFPELVQDEASAENMADTAHGLLTDPKAYHKVIDDIKKVQQRLGSAGAASDRVAIIAQRLMEGGRAV